MIKRQKRFRPYVVLLWLNNGRLCGTVCRHYDLTTQNEKGIHTILHKKKKLMLLLKREKRTLYNRDMKKINVIDYYDLDKNNVIPNGLYLVGQGLDGSFSNLPETILGIDASKNVVIEDQKSQLNETKDVLHLKSERMDILGSKDQLDQHIDEEMERLGKMRKQIYVAPKED